MLISGFGLPPVVAVGTDLLFASITKATAAWRHQRLANIDWTILRWLAAGSLPRAAAVLLPYSARRDQRGGRSVQRWAIVVRAQRQTRYPGLHADALSAFDLRNTVYGRIATIVLGAVLSVRWRSRRLGPAPSSLS
jgi:hypothetical protein